MCVPCWYCRFAILLQSRVGSKNRNQQASKSGNVWANIDKVAGIMHVGRRAGMPCAVCVAIAWENVNFKPTRILKEKWNYFPCSKISRPLFVWRYFYRDYYFYYKSIEKMFTTSIVIILVGLDSGKIVVILSEAWMMGEEGSIKSILCATLPRNYSDYYYFPSFLLSFYLRRYDERSRDYQSRYCCACCSCSCCCFLLSIYMFNLYL